MTELPINTKKARVFDIQRFSLNDGPGIRTTIFFKGCPLRCEWCHNPESFLSGPQFLYNESLCVNCMECIPVCLPGAHDKIEYQGQEKHVFDHELCNLCGECVKVCCYEALKIIGKEYSTKELLDELKPDLVYYELPNESLERGGITLSGGEPMNQVDFIADFLDLTDGIHICMDTSGYAPPENFLKILPKIDLFLFDYKVTDPEKHIYYCGVDNALILSNLDLLYHSGANIVLRFPIIPGVNDNLEHFEGIAKLMKKYDRIEYGEIMAYHNLGISKIEQFGMMDMGIHQKSVNKEERSKWISIIKSYGIHHIR
ncbi:glycyl-radical enzyme activating protein [Petrocella sp. FN5]|uniref:glycyl-radical enzyme activating protein n=1 Tax=Petrocella sp. FN5 TaxID=3032002 RepID=UPI0023DCEB80|nr:glycyl-radical enzyme activating protein [Petrocella sp. FN5]MDF1617895.1 glycyl-radical enzyme activating protein [Petrocella sp. FN5]